MSGTISIKPTRTIADLQDDFNRVYPYLRIDFYKAVKSQKQYHAAARLDRQLPLKTCGIGREGDVVLYDTMTVGELEKSFRDRFGANVQVSRKSGKLWLETTMTDNWTLQQQNDHGRELSGPLPAEEGTPDYE